MGSKRVAAVRIIGPAVLALAVVLGGVGPASATPTAVPAPLQRLAALAGHQASKPDVRTAGRQALRLGSDDDETYLYVAPDCAKGTGKAKPHGSVVSTVKLKLDYVLTGSGLRKTGTVKAKAQRETSLKLKAVHAGRYRLTLTLHGKTDLVADETFDVRPCVTVATTCRAVTFTNPAGNPAAVLSYHGHSDEQEFDVALAPGTSRTVRADFAKIDYEAYPNDIDDPSALGDGTVKVKQKCSHLPAQPGANAVQTFAVLGCATPDDSGSAVFAWSAQPSVTQGRWEVLDSRQRVVVQGSFEGGQDTEQLLSTGTYTYRSYANENAQPFENVAFTVLGCVQVTPRCRALEIRNPNAVALDVIVVSDENDDEGAVSTTTLAAHATETVPWTATTAWVVAIPEGELDDASVPFVNLASPWPPEGDLDDLQSVPQNC